MIWVAHLRNKIESLYRESLTVLDYYETLYPGFKSYTLRALFLIGLFELISDRVYEFLPVPYIGVQPLRFSIAQEIDSALIFIFWGWATLALIKAHLRSHRL
jgi:hypothetical protein